MEGGRNCGPYKATKLWNEMIQTFRNGIPLKRHRRHIKVYENCFTGHEAIIWFQSVLQNNLHLGNIVTREQTVQLLNKFIRAGVFQNVNAATPFDIHYQYLKEGDLYQLSGISSPRLPLGNKSQNIPLKSKVGHWNVKNVEATKKVPFTSHVHPHMSIPRLDAHHTIGLPLDEKPVLRSVENNWNCQSTNSLPISDIQIRNKQAIFQNLQPEESFRKDNFNQVLEDFGLTQSNIPIAPVFDKAKYTTSYTNLPEEASLTRGPSFPGGSKNTTGFCEPVIQPTYSYENQLQGSPQNYNKEVYRSSAEKIKLHSPVIKQNHNPRPGKRSPHSRLYTDSCKWLEPLTLDSVDNAENTNVQHTTTNYKQVESYTTLPRTHTSQTHAKTSQTKPDLNKVNIYNVKDGSERSVYNVKAQQINSGTLDFTKSSYPQNIRKSPYSGMNTAKFPVLRSNPHISMSNGSLQGKNEERTKEVQQIHHYRSTSSSQVGSNQNITTSSNVQKGMPLRRTGSLRPTKKVIVPVYEPQYSLNIGEIWKKVITNRFEKLTPGLGISLKLELQYIPGEWLSGNASNEGHLQHDAHFPQSLVAAMNCLVHWPQAVPNEIITAFKEHYFKLQEPLLTFKLYNILTKVFLYVATGNLAMSKGMVLKQTDSALNSLKAVVLPPNSCFETAFTSDSPITRIVPQRSVDTLHFSRHGRQSKNALPKRIASAPNLCEQLPNVQTAQKPNIRSTTKRQMGRRAMKISNRKVSRRVRVGVEDDSKLCHFRNKSGGYVNPALSRSIDDIDNEDFGIDKMKTSHHNEHEEQLDYVAALESLNTLMRCSRRDKPSFLVGGVGVDTESDREQNGSRSSESSSYYTAVSSSSSAASSRRSSGVLVDSLENVDTAGTPVHVNIGTSGESSMVTLMQLLFLCIPTYNRTQLRYLLHFMNQWNMHHSLCVQTDVLDIFTPTILRSECEANYDPTLARSIVYFLMSHHELVLSVPNDLEAEVQHIINQETQNVSRKDVNPPDPVTYCQQVSSQQFEQQRLTGSQLALSELLEQILADCKMGCKEKRKRLKMFQQSYPHIYHRRFPEASLEDKMEKKQSRGLLNLATLSRLRSLRV